MRQEKYIDDSGIDSNNWINSWNLQNHIFLTVCSTFVYLIFPSLPVCPRGLPLMKRHSRNSRLLGSSRLCKLVTPKPHDEKKHSHILEVGKRKRVLRKNDFCSVPLSRRHFIACAMIELYILSSSPGTHLFNSSPFQISVCVSLSSLLFCNFNKPDLKHGLLCICVPEAEWIDKSE